MTAWIILALSAYLLAGLCMLIVVFALLAHRWTIKPFAVVLTILSAAATYFISKYDVAVDSSMVLNTVHTDVTEVGQLLSLRMVPYVVFLMVLPVLIILSIKITFRPSGRYLLDSLKLISIGLLIALACLYSNYKGISSGRQPVEQVHRLFARAHQRDFEFHQRAFQVTHALPGAAEEGTRDLRSRLVAGKPGRRARNRGVVEEKELQPLWIRPA